MSTYTRLDRPQPFDHLVNQSKSNPEAIAMDGPMGPVTYRKLYERAKKYSSFLRKRGVKPGDSVVLRILNADTVPVLWACWSLGASTAVFPWQIDTSSQRNFDWLISLQDEPDFPVSRLIHVDSAVRNSINAESIIGEIELFNHSQPIHTIFSSGTTGSPKGVPFEYELLEARAWNARRIWMPELPFFSLIGLTSASGFFGMYSAISHGETYLYPTVSENNLKLAAGHRVATIKGSPAQLTSLVATARIEKVNLPALKFIESAGGFLPTNATSDLKAWLPDAQILNLYGSTEGGTIIADQIPEDVTPSHFWNLLPNARVEIVDADDNPIPAGEVGKVRIRNLPMADQYLKNPDASKVAFKDGWFYPGDLGVLSETGCLQLQGRASELINISGVKLDPAEIDIWLLEQRGILDAAAFAYRTSNGDPGIGLALSVIPNFDRKDFLRNFQRRFYNLIPNAVLPLKQVPRNELGKVLRRELAAQVEAKLSK